MCCLRVAIILLTGGVFGFVLWSRGWCLGSSRSMVLKLKDITELCFVVLFE